MLRDTSYERHLPHQVPANTPIFLTWNLKGAVTREMLDIIEQERVRLAQQAVRPGESRLDRTTREEKILFALEDSMLGKTDRGPMYLKEPEVARIVVDSILFGAATRYSLFAFVVMGNHAHALLTPIIPLSKITQGIKGFTSHQINELHNARGRIFWQDESYDHWVRDEEEFYRIIEYIERNPVVARLCPRPEDWLWSSATMRRSWPVGQAFQPDMSSLSQAGKPDLQAASGWKA